MSSDLQKDTRRATASALDRGKGPDQDQGPRGGDRRGRPGLRSGRLKER